METVCVYEVCSSQPCLGVGVTLIIGYGAFKNRTHRLQQMQNEEMLIRRSVQYVRIKMPELQRTDAGMP